MNTEELIVETSHLPGCAPESYPKSRMVSFSVHIAYAPVFLESFNVRDGGDRVKEEVGRPAFHSHRHHLRQGPLWNEHDENAKRQAYE